MCLEINFAQPSMSDLYAVPAFRKQWSSHVAKRNDVSGRWLYSTPDFMQKRTVIYKIVSLKLNIIMYLQGRFEATLSCRAGAGIAC